MKMSEALKIISGVKRVPGYRVHFGKREGCALVGDFFPDRGEKLIATKAEAIRLAKEFAKKTEGVCYDVYPIYDDFTPVETGVDYEKRLIFNRR